MQIVLLMEVASAKGMFLIKVCWKVIKYGILFSEFSTCIFHIIIPAFLQRAQDSVLSSSATLVLTTTREVGEAER